MNFGKFQFLIWLLIGHVCLAGENTYEKSIEAAKLQPSAKNVIELGGHLRGIARYNNPPESSQYYNKVKETLLAIPGHARYFNEEIERMRLAGQDPSNERHRFYVETLPHLPSPETVWVLGSLLHDMRDKQVHNECMSTLGESAWLAFKALPKTGLRNLPPLDRTPMIGATPGPGEQWTHRQHLQAEMDAINRSRVRAEKHLKYYQNWWEKVKSGRNSFSFKGQKVEYRFKPDGTWDTLAMVDPPDDAPGRPEAGAAHRPVKRPDTLASAAVPGPGIRQWPWILAAMIVLLGSSFWWAMRSSPERS